MDMKKVMLSIFHLETLLGAYAQLPCRCLADRNLSSVNGNSLSANEYFN